MWERVDEEDTSERLTTGTSRERWARMREPKGQGDFELDKKEFKE
jgi:hypothetical protein